MSSLLHVLPLAPKSKEASAYPLGPATRGSCSGKVRREDGLLVTKARQCQGRGRGRSEGRGSRLGRRAAMPPASILSPGLDGKASPTRDLPAPTAPCGRKPSSPQPLGDAVRGGARGTEPRAGCRMPSRVALKAGACYSPPQMGLQVQVRHCTLPRGCK